MDVRKFRDSRESEIDEFKKQYNFLKTEYTSVLSSAINEKDPAKQQELIQQVLSLNSGIADEVRTIIGKLNQGSYGVDPKELNDLTNDLIQYQKDYETIEEARDKVNTLKLIHSSARKKLESAEVMYNIYIAVLIGLTFFIAFLVFRTEWSRNMVSTVSSVLST